MEKAVEAQRMAVVAISALNHTRNTCRKLATPFDEAELTQMRVCT